LSRCHFSDLLEFRRLLLQEEIAEALTLGTTLPVVSRFSDLQMVVPQVLVAGWLVALAGRDAVAAVRGLERQRDAFRGRVDWRAELVG
jgi:hypothetical protein